MDSHEMFPFIPPHKHDYRDMRLLAPLCASCSELLVDEVGHVASLVAIGQMSRQDGEGSLADGIALGADDLGLGFGEVGNLGLVLGVLGVAEHEGRHDLVLLGLGQVLDSAVSDGGTLAVAADDQHGVGALGVDFANDLLHLRDTGGVSAARQEVSGETSGIVDSLNGHALKLAFDVVGSLRTANGTHVADLGRTTSEDHNDVFATASRELLGGGTDTAALAGFNIASLDFKNITLIKLGLGKRGERSRDRREGENGGELHRDDFEKRSKRMAHRAD